MGCERILFGPLVRRLSAAVTAVVTIALTSGCVQKESTQESALVYLSGPTNRAMLNQVVESLAIGKRDFLIDSFGGEESTAIMIAEQLEKARSASITVNKYCTSSCASYLLVGASRVKLNRDALIMYHMTSYGLVQLAILDKVPDEIAENAVKSESLYRRRGVSTEILLGGTRFLGPYCLLPDKGKYGTLFSSADNWIPSRKFATESGLAISGSWPATFGEAERIVRLRMRRPIRLVYGEPNTGDRPLMKAMPCPKRS